MNTPLNIPRYVQLSSDVALTGDVVRSWYCSVKDAAPNGVLATIQKVDEKGFPQAVKMIHREQNGKHRYLVPISRDLAPLEVERIVESFGDNNPNQDFEIETNATNLNNISDNTIDIETGQHVALCTALAKQKHEEWLKERMDAGWRYGPTFSIENKTHQLLVSWESLPDRYRVPDLEWPQKLVDVLGQNGYQVIAKDDLAKLLSLLQGTI